MLDDKIREGISKDSNRILSAKKTINIDRKHSISEAVRACPECGSNNLVTDPTRAENYCADCGVVIEDYQPIPTLDDPANRDMERYDLYPTNFAQQQKLLPNPLSPQKASFLVGAPLPSEMDKFVKEITENIIEKTFKNLELRNNIRDETIKKVQHEYKELYKSGFKRFGPIKYREHMVEMLAYMELNNNKEVNTHHPEPFTVEIPERLINENFEPYKKLYFAVHDPDRKKREKMYRYCNLSDALLIIYSGSFGSRQGVDMFFELLIRGNKIKGSEIRGKAEECGLTYKTGFMACLAIYTIKALEKHDDIKYLKSKKGVLKVLKIPETTYDNRMKELRAID